MSDHVGQSGHVVGDEPWNAAYAISQQLEGLDTTTCHVLPFLNRMNISASFVFARNSSGKASSMRRLPVTGLTAVQMALRPCVYSGSMCQSLGITVPPALLAGADEVIE